jgi:hypothetical protein
MELSTLVADIDGHQRKIVSWAIRPARAEHGAAGLVLRDGRSLPFVVERSWNAPAGNYPERWYIVDPASREVLYEGPERLARIWGLQSWTELRDQISTPIELRPGSYWLVFALGGIMGGQVDFEAAEAEAEAATA